MDVCNLVYVRGNRYEWLVAVDQHWIRWVYLQGSLEGAEERAELFPMRMLVKSVLSWYDHVVQTDGNVCGTQVQTTAAYSLWQKVRVEQSSRKRRTKRVCNIEWRMSIVSYEVVHALNERTGSWESPSDTSVRPANGTLRRTDGTREVVSRSKVVNKRDQLARRFIMQASAREVLESYVALAAIRRIDISHIRSCWFDGRAFLCAAKPLRGVASHKGDRWDRDESRQVDELRNCDASTFCWESPARDNESAIGHPGTVLSGQCSKIGENRCSDSARDSSECIPSNCVINGMVSESQGVWTCRVSVYEENPPEVEEPLFFEWLVGNRQRCLDRKCKGCFWNARFSLWMVETIA